MKTHIATLALIALLGCITTAPAADPASGEWTRLLEGNARFAAGKPQYPNQDAARRAATATGQKPFAVIVGCADSRTPPELLFDQGLGDLFVVRVAGNVIDAPALGSVEFAVANLGARLIVVLGHEKCGAVSAAVAALKGAPAPPGHIGSLVEAIKPAAAQARAAAGDPMENAVNANARRVVEQLKTTSSVLRPFLDRGELRVIGARYELASGKVEQIP